MGIRILPMGHSHGTLQHDVWDTHMEHCTTTRRVGHSHGALQHDVWDTHMGHYSTTCGTLTWDTTA